MREEELRSVLLVKAIEETDRDGALIPAADRLAASKAAKRAFPVDESAATVAGRNLSRAAQRMLLHRTRALLGQMRARHPFLDDVQRHSSGAWIGWIAVAIALFFGIGLSALDGSRRINVLAFPLLGLVLWNLLVYASVVFAWIRAALRRPPLRRPLPAWATAAGLQRLSSLIARSRPFNAPLAESLGRYAREWHEAARPLLMRRAAAVFHLGAAAVGAGLIMGLYLRGIALDYQAGWESTFLDGARARELLSVLYGPASLLTGIAIPDVAHLEAIRWRDHAGGESAAPWIHLLAATAFMFIVLPRLVLALLAGLSIWRRARNAPLPASLPAYFRAAFGGLGLMLDRGIAMVVPYAYEPGTNALASVRRYLAREAGENVTVDLRASVAFGNEEPFLEGIGSHGGDVADVIVLLTTLAATPEDENHGLVMAGLRDWIARSRPQARLMIVVDEGPYAARMGAMPGRLEERRSQWRDFIVARGLEPRLVDLSE